MRYAIVQDSIVVAVFAYKWQRDVCCVQLVKLFPEGIWRSITVEEVQV